MGFLDFYVDPWVLFLLSTVVLSGTQAGVHSLKYFQTSLAVPGLKEPRFISMGYVDDQQFVRFDSDNFMQREEPQVQWLDKIPKEERERNLRIVIETALTFQEGLDNLQIYYNQSSGVHTYQRLVGCEMSSDGTFRGAFEQFAYDGQDYISLDLETLSWTAAVVPAMNSKRKWDSERSIAERQKVYLEKNCVEWLKKYLEYGKEMLLRTEPPSVRVTHHTASNGEVILRCRAQDFYPSGISLSWLKNGEEQLQDTEFIETRPAGDGTFQKWAAVRITSGQEGKYSCRIQHEGLSEPLILQWEPQSSSTLIIVESTTLVLLIAVLAGVVIWRMKDSGGKGGDYFKAAGNDSSQDSENLSHSQSLRQLCGMNLSKKTDIF